MRTKPFVPPPVRIHEVTAPVDLPPPAITPTVPQEATTALLQPVAGAPPAAPLRGPSLHESVILGGNTFEPVQGPLAYACRQAIMLTRQGVPWVILAEDDTILLRLLAFKTLEGKEEYRVLFQTLENLLLLEMVGAMRTAYEGLLADIKPSARKKDVMDHIQALCTEMQNIQKTL